MPRIIFLQTICKCIPAGSAATLLILSSPYFFSRHCLPTNSYDNTIVEGNVVKPTKTKMKIRTEVHVGKVGVMLVGIGGNNGKFVDERLILINI